MEKTKSLTQPNSYIFTDFLFYTKSSIQVNIFLLQYLSKRIVENTFPWAGGPKGDTGTDGSPGTHTSFPSISYCSFVDTLGSLVSSPGVIGETPRPGIVEFRRFG